MAIESTRPVTAPTNQVTPAQQKAKQESAPREQPKQEAVAPEERPDLEETTKILDVTA
jgi:hypothetical protein